MQHYTVTDFIRYYGDSWMIHPKTGELFRIHSQSGDVVDAIVTTQGDVLRLHEIDWHHVKTPDVLGYRCLMDGKGLYYLTRKAGRRTRKGVTPEAIVVGIPPHMKALSEEVGAYTELYRHANIQGDWLPKEIWKPTFVSIDEAVEKLSTKKHTLGFAISHNWAVMLGLYKEEPFLLHFKNIRVAGSSNGKDWNFYDKDSKILFDQFKEAA